MNNYKAYINQQFDTQITKNFCSQIEKDLRLQIHSILLETMNKVNPLENAVYDHMNYVSIDVITLFD